MSKSELQEIREVMKRFDPLLVAAAIGDTDMRSGIVSEEVANIKTTLKRFDRREVAEAAAEYLGKGSVVFSCGGPVCTCPEDGGCGVYTIRPEIDKSLFRLGTSMVESLSALESNVKAGAVVGVQDRLGFAGLCWESVKCSGQQIFVMHGCLHSLYAFDLSEGMIDPIDAIVTIAKANPGLSKRVSAMVKEMEKAGEITG
jgi:hypothetical protein